jgi:uncharacterized protein YneR
VFVGDPDKVRAFCAKIESKGSSSGRFLSCFSSSLSPGFGLGWWIGWAKGESFDTRAKRLAFGIEQDDFWWVLFGGLVDA